jgi:hypothetical protein
MNEIYYTWSFSDDKNRWKLWYIIAISFVLWLSIWGIFMSFYGLSFIVIFMAWVYFFIENNSSDTVQVNVTELWIKIDETFYDYSKIKSFSFVYIWEQMVFLRLFTNDVWVSKVDLKIDNEHWKNLREILSNFLAEDKSKNLTVLDKIIISLKL